MMPEHNNQATKELRESTTSSRAEQIRADQSRATLQRGKPRTHLHSTGQDKTGTRVVVVVVSRILFPCLFVAGPSSRRCCSYSFPPSPRRRARARARFVSLGNVLHVVTAYPLNPAIIFALLRVFRTISPS